MLESTIFDWDARSIDQLSEVNVFRFGTSNFRRIDAEIVNHSKDPTRLGSSRCFCTISYLGLM